ncbi:hypothetical protein PR002_g27652, partial [Phytophthora rubi]
MGCSAPSARTFCRDLASSTSATTLRTRAISITQPDWGQKAASITDASPCVGNQLVYRISFSLGCFFTLTALLSCAVARGCENFFDGYVDIACVASALFIILQIIIILDSTYSLRDYILDKSDEADRDDDAAWTRRNQDHVGGAYLALVFVCMALSIAGLRRGLGAVPTVGFAAHGRDVHGRGARRAVLRSTSSWTTSRVRSSSSNARRRARTRTTRPTRARQPLRPPVYRGIARALRVFLEKDHPPVYTLEPRVEGPHHITVKPNTKLLRPYVVSAVLRDVHFAQERYDSFIDLQDKLHQNTARSWDARPGHDPGTLHLQRTYAAISVALLPNEIKLKPLSQDKEFEAKELLVFYRTNPDVKHIKPYTDIIYDSPVYPMITDKNGVVLSL